MSKPKPSISLIHFLAAVIGVITVLSCSLENSKKAPVPVTPKAEVKPEKATVTITPMYLRTGADQKSEILPLHIEFSVQKETKEYVEDQIDEIKRILIVYFSDVNPGELKSKNAFIQDSNLTSTINDFLKSGHIETSKYKVIKEVL